MYSVCGLFVYVYHLQVVAKILTAYETSAYIVTVVDPHAPGGVKHFDRLGVKRKFEEMQRVCCLHCLPAIILLATWGLDFLLIQILLQGEDTGNWVLENAKSRLHLFLQQTRQPKDMQIRPTGPDHNRSVGVTTECQLLRSFCSSTVFV